MSNKDKSKKAAVKNQEPAFGKEQILGFKRYAGRRDLLSALLQEGQQYTTAQVDRLLADFMRNKANKMEVEQ